MTLSQDSANEPQPERGVTAHVQIGLTLIHRMKLFGETASRV